MTKIRYVVATTLDGPEPAQSQAQETKPILVLRNGD
jgi:hypothetical protein